MGREEVPIAREVMSDESLAVKAWMLRAYQSWVCGQGSVTVCICVCVLIWERPELIGILRRSL
jgi:hypothetical protein